MTSPSQRRPDSQSERAPIRPSDTSQNRALLAIGVLSALAMADGVYLTLVHIDLEVGARGLGAICHALARQGCAITGGRYGAFFGVPTALFGFAGATATFTLNFRASRRAPALRQSWLLGLLVLSGVSVASSLAMALISLISRSYCPFCVLWYALNLGIAAAATAAWRARPLRGSPVPDPAVHGRAAGPGEPPEVSPRRLTTALGSVAMLAGVTFIVALVAGQLTYRAALAPRMAERAAQVAEEIQKRKTHPPVTIRVNGVVIRQTAEANLIVFSDFECPHCRKLWHRLAQLPDLTGRNIHTTHLNFPLDPACHNKIGHAFHKRACAAAWAAECARDAGRFHAYATLLFDHQHALEDDDLRSYAQSVGMDLASFERCVASPNVRERVGAHLRAGFDAHVRGTPMLFVNGVSFPVNLPAPLLAGAIEVLLAK